MDSEILKKYKKSGKILSEIQKKARKIIKPGVKLLGIAENLEKEIRQADKEAGVAFPVNLSRNHEAAHYTPSYNDETVVGEKDVIKVDIGVHVDGYITDSAFTLDFSGEHSKMIEANEKALENVISMLKPGLEINKIGTEIEKTLKDAGFIPIQNLSGHGLDRYTQHASPSIPNISERTTAKLQDNTAFAIEPFASTGKGLIKEASQVEIYMLENPRLLRNTDSRKMIEYIEENHKTLPFAERHVWNAMKVSEFKFKVAFRELIKNKIISTYPVLVEEEGVITTQAETCFAICDGKVHLLVDVLKNR